MEVAEMPAQERPLSERFRLVAEKWVDAKAAADLLEDTKSSRLSNMILEVREKDPKIAHNKAEVIVKGSDEWVAIIEQIVEARREANLWRVRMDYLEMKFSEWQSRNANARQERYLSK